MKPRNEEYAKTINEDHRNGVRTECRRRIHIDTPPTSTIRRSIAKLVIPIILNAVIALMSDDYGIIGMIP